MTVIRFTAPPVPATLVSVALPSGSTSAIGKAEVPRLGHVLEAGIAEVAAGHLRAALHQVADAAALSEQSVVERIPAELVDHRRDEDRRIGDAAGDDDLRAGLQRLDDRLGAEVHLG